MAGSYGHVAPVPDPNDDADDSSRGAWSLVENMGDAYETVEKLLWLALYFASPGRGVLIDVVAADAAIRKALDEVYCPQARGERAKDEAFRAVEQVMRA